MKKIQYILPFLAFLAVASCKKDLKETPYGFLSTSNFYKTGADATSALLYAYSINSDLDYYERNFIVLTELPTEDVAEAAGKSADELLADENAVTSTNSLLAPAYQAPYVGINRANLVITYVPAITNGLTDSAKNEILGEAYSLRALHYFNLVRFFGAVPLHLTPVSDDSQTNLPKSSIQAIYTQIIADLTKAIPMMDETQRLGRFNKVGAWALLSKVYLELASAKSSGAEGYDWVTDANAEFTLAQQYSGYVVSNQSVYGLDPSLTDIYNVGSKFGPEHILDAPFDRSGTAEGLYSKLPLFFYPNLNFTLAPAPSNGTEADEFIPGGFGEFLTEPGLFNSFDPNDKRKTQLIIDTIYNVGGGKDGTGPTQPLLITGTEYRPFTNKYNDAGWTIGQQTGANTPIIRYSDILLVYAEACGPTTAGYAALGQIRARAGLGNVPPGLSVADFRNAVLQERSWELCFEGNRLFDLRRTNNMVNILTNIYGKKITGDPNFFPIPQSEVDQNPNLNK